MGRLHMSDVWRPVGAGSLAMLVIALAACSMAPTVDDFIPNAPKFEVRTLPSNPSLRPTKAPALVGQDGGCAADSGEFLGGGIAVRRRSA